MNRFFVKLAEHRTMLRIAIVAAVLVVILVVQVVGAEAGPWDIGP